MSALENILRKVNSKVNAETRYVSDSEKYQRSDYWVEMIDNEGDCDDYMMTKRRILLNKYKIPHHLIRIALCWTETPSVYHAVLIVSDVDCDWVLDNRFPDIMKPSELKGYVFHKIQIPGTSKFEYVKQTYANKDDPKEV